MSGDQEGAKLSASSETLVIPERSSAEGADFLRRSSFASRILKRTFRLSNLLPVIDADRVLYPHGVVSTLMESGEHQQQEQVRRIEVFAEDSSDSTYGILRSMFVAFSSERKLLDLAQASDNVIEVRSFPSSRGQLSARSKGQRQMVGDRLVLKRIEPGEQGPPTPSLSSSLSRAPQLLVPTGWLDRANLVHGTQILVSNPIERYVVPPPDFPRSTTASPQR